MNNRRITQMGMSTLTALMSCFLGVAQAAENLINSDVIDQAMDVVAQKEILINSDDFNFQ